MLSKVLVVILSIVVVVVLIALPVMFLWNMIMPNVCGVTTITFWQSLGICVMGNIISGTAFNYSKEE